MPNDERRDQGGGVRRDGLGIPHLWADDVIALARLQGRTTALDRGWQIEHQRWRMEGRTAEHIGIEGVRWDRFARQVRIEATARACYERLDDETRAFVHAYVGGVNEALGEGLGRAPEVDLLGLRATLRTPRPWEPWTPLGIFWAIHLLFGTFPSKLFNQHVVATLGREWLPLLHAEGLMQSGSNAWVVGGSRTASGKPIIAGDPHRTIELPGCYQQVGLACPEFDVVGFTFPGVPGVQHFAHAGSVAWGITNAMADYQDLTIEELRQVGGHLSVRGLSGWEPVSHSTETVVVKGDSSIVVPVVVTERGPVITGLDAWPATSGSAAGRPTTHSLRTPSQVATDLGFGALLPLLRSRTVDDVETALTQWVEPVNSALIADDTGRMRHVVVGRVAQRHQDNLVLPLPAWDPRHVWDGWVPTPATEVTDVMVSANDRASGGGLGVEYATPFRANRIRELIGEPARLEPLRHGVDDSRRIHVDTLNGQAVLMRRLVSRAEVSGDAAKVRAQLLEWDGHSIEPSRGAAVFAAWRHALVHWFAEQPQLAPLHEPSGHSHLFEAWLNVPLQLGSGWHSMVSGAGELGVDVEVGVRESLERVAAQGDWITVWGDRHWFDPVHALDGIGGVPTGPQIGLPGDKGCVLAAGSAPGITDRCYVGPVARYVWDLGDRDASRWIVPLGASGVPGDKHFDDQFPAWAAGGLAGVADGVDDRTGIPSE